MTVTPPELETFAVVFPRFPINNITPFTYRDGWTFLELVEGMRAYVRDTLVPGIDKNFEDLVSSFQDALDQIIADNDATVAEFNQMFLDFRAEFEAIVDTINNKTGMIEVQHRTLIADTLLVIDPTWPDNLPVIFEVTQDAVGGHEVTFPTNVSGYASIGKGPGAVTRIGLYPNGDDTWYISDWLFGSAVYADAYDTLAEVASTDSIYLRPPGSDKPIPGNIYNQGGSEVDNYDMRPGVTFGRGTPTILATDPGPVFSVQKFSGADRPTAESRAWDQGAYISIEKYAGSAFAAALTGFVRHDSTDGGDAIGVHGRGSAYQAESEVWGGWFYAHAGEPLIVPQSLIGVEINLNSRVADQGYNAATGFSKGLLVVTQDSSLPVTIGIEVGRGSGAPNGHIHTGMKFRSNSIFPSPANTADTITDNAYIELNGSAFGSDSNGIVFKTATGRWRTGISFPEGGFESNAAIVIGNDNRIVVANGGGSSRYVRFGNTDGAVDFNNLLIKLNNVQVLSGRKTGWGVPAGLTSKATFDVDTVTTPQLAQRVAALINDLTNHGLIGA